jgi:preprotein translocase subunit SecG
MVLQTAVLIFHVFLAVALIAMVLIQRGKGAEAGAAFGAGASGTVFGARGSASFLTRVTAGLATLFFCTSLALAFLSGQQPKAVSLMESGTTSTETVPSLVPAQEQPAAQPADLPDLQEPVAEEPESGEEAGK